MTTPKCVGCPFPGCDSCAYKGHERVVLIAAPTLFDVLGGESA